MVCVSPPAYRKMRIDADVTLIQNVINQSKSHHFQTEATGRSMFCVFQVHSSCGMRPGAGGAFCWIVPLLTPKAKPSVCGIVMTKNIHPCTGPQQAHAGMC